MALLTACKMDIFTAFQYQGENRDREGSIMLIPFFFKAEVIGLEGQGCDMCWGGGCHHQQQLSF